MKKVRRVFLGVVGLLVMLGLLVGCYRPAAPDVTPTSGGTAGAIQPEEEGTAALEATTIPSLTSPVQTPKEEEILATDTPTEPTVPTASALPPTATSVPATPAPTAPVPTLTAPPSGEVTHVVQPGDTLFSIARRYGSTVEAIASANGIANSTLIYVGQELIIPSPSAQRTPAPTGETTYVVEPGDTLFSIAQRYDMSYLELAEYNGIANPASIYVGQVLRIPLR